MATHGDPDAAGAAASTRERRHGRHRWLVAALAVATLLACAVGAGFQADQHEPPSALDVAVIEADQGDVVSVLIENGAVESASDDVVRCQVESFLRLPVAAPAGEFVPTIAPIKSAVDLIRRLPSRARATAGDTAMARVTSGSEGRQGAGAKGQIGGSSAATGASSNVGSLLFQRPLIRSFEHEVEPYVSLRSTLPDQNVMLAAPPQPPTIISIVPEGTHVKASNVVCELDSSVFRNALPVQKARYVQARAWLDQAHYILEANEIALQEYEQGVLPQDLELVRDYISICEIEAEQARRNLAWSRATTSKGFRTPAQLEADAAAFEEAEIVLRDARGMLAQLHDHTGRRILTAHRAKIAAIRADLFSLESAFRLETRRLRQIEETIAHCTIRAPRDGVVVYANRVNGWGGVERQIREGLAVHKSQPLFRLLDPRRMHVKAVINESQVAKVKSGQPVSIYLEAFPEQPLRGSVVEVTPVPSLARGPLSDVHSYAATVKIESGRFDDLREGLSAELKIELETHRGVTRVPLESIRWVGDQTFVALARTTAQGLNWLWKPVELGVSDTTFAEVVSGLAPGDRVIAQSDVLPAPEPVIEGTLPDDAVAMEDSHTHR